MGSRTGLWFKVGIAAIILFLFDQGTRNFELNSMVTQLQKSEVKMLSYYEDTAYWYKLYTDGSRSAVATETEVARIARESAPVISAVGANVESIYILPWHREIIRAKQDFLDLNNAWVSSLSADAVIDEEFGDERLNQEVRNNWEILKFSLPNALPMVDLYSLESKTTNIIGD